MEAEIRLLFIQVGSYVAGDCGGFNLFSRAAQNFAVSLDSFNIQELFVLLRSEVSERSRCAPLYSSF
jgi:hypothetical protein